VLHVQSCSELAIIYRVGRHEVRTYTCLVRLPGQHLPLPSRGVDFPRTGTGARVEDLFEIDSAGTSGYHAGCDPDRRSVETAKRRGVEVTGTSRQITDEDLRSFDYVIAMDGANFAEIDQLKAAADGDARISRLREWDPSPDSLDVPDPYYGGTNGFDHVHDIVERCCAALLDELVAAHVPAER